MPTTYTNGLKLPDLGSIDWFNAYKNNIDILDPIVGTVNGVATTYAPISHNHDASEITSGTIDIARLPPAALERLTTVADQTARYALTTSTVQLGDTIKQLDTGIMYLVVDTTKLNSADGYVEYSAGTASKAIADEDGTSIKTGYVNVAGDQTVSGDKSFTGSNTFNNILPNATGTYSLGSSSYQWSSVYAQTYYYNGTAWGLDKANVWSAGNTFNQAVISNSSFWIASADLQAKNQSTLTSARLNKIGNESSDGKAFQKFEMKVDATYTDTAYCVNYYNTSGNIAYDFVIRQRVDNQGTKQFYPSVSGVADLGTSTNKWKTLNGINPGALSLPDASKSVTVDTTNYTWTGSDNTYVAPADGWLSLKTTTGLSGRLEGTTTGIGSIVERSAGGRLVLLHIPVLKNESVTVSGNGSDFILKFFPCLGNV